LIIGPGLKGKYAAGPKEVSPEDVKIAVTLPGMVDFFVERVRSLGSKEGSMVFWSRNEPAAVRVG
jgi:hypothetical protein